jgi:hypothetical protein
MSRRLRWRVHDSLAAQLSQGVLDGKVALEEARMLISATLALRDAYRNGTVKDDVFQEHVDSVFR